MRSRGFGRIIIISSINGQKGQMGQTNYSAAKAGVIGFAKALAQENANKGITVNVIAPGYIATEMVQAVPEEVLKTKILPLIPVGRLGEADEIARTRPVPGGRRCRLHHGLDADGQRRPVHGVTRAPGRCHGDRRSGRASSSGARCATRGSQADKQRLNARRDPQDRAALVQSGRLSSRMTRPYPCAVEMLPAPR